jgi:hypothetical protein
VISFSRGRAGTLLLKGFVVVSAAWTFFSIFMLLRWALTHTSAANADARPIYSAVELPTLSPSTVYRDLPGIQQSLATFNSSSDSLQQPVRLAVVYQSDSTCFVELTYVSDCGCPAEKIDRYEITRTAIDPVTGTILTRLSEGSLSAERLTRYFGGLTRIRRFQ